MTEMVSADGSQPPEAELARARVTHPAGQTTDGSREAGLGPLVTIAIPSYNHAQYVTDCIRSVIAQDYENIELIIIDDGSSDQSSARIEALMPECRARFARFEFRARDNCGLATTLNEAVDWAQGIYFALIASDDLLLASKTSVLVDALEQEPLDVAGIFAGGDLIDEVGGRTRTLVPPERYYGFDDIVQRRHFIVTPCQLLKLEKLKQAGPVPTSLFFEDWYLWLALTSTGDRLRVIAGALVGYRQHGTNMSKNVGKMLQGRMQVLGHFADSRFYDVAVAKCHLMAAMDYSATSKRLSVRSLLSGLRHDWRILGSRSFMRLVGKLLIPNVALRHLKGVRSQAQRRARHA